MAKPHYSGPWQRLRKQILQRDGGICQIQGEGCTQIATQVDHIVPVAQGGAWWDPSNLRASCAHCNNRRIDRGRNETWRTSHTRITLVIGPPGAGKTTYVAETKSESDLVVDYDAIAQALGRDATHEHGGDLHAATMAARNAVLRSLRQGKVRASRAWIISANPRAEEMFPYHAVQLIDPGIDEVLQRAEQAGRPERWKQLIRDWYATRSGAVTVGSSRPW